MYIQGACWYKFLVGILGVDQMAGQRVTGFVRHQAMCLLGAVSLNKQPGQDIKKDKYLPICLPVVLLKKQAFYANNNNKITIRPCVFLAVCLRCQSATRRQTSSSPESYQAAACETTRLRFKITFMLTTDAGIQMKNRVWSH